MITVECPGCCDGSAEVDDVAHDLEYLVIKCESCGKEHTIGIRDWSIDGDREL